jgi:hypothetical protein
MAKKQMANEAEEADKVEQPVEAPQGDEPVVAKSESRNGGAEEADFNKTAGDMKALLDAQPKVRVLVPLENGEKLGEFLPVNINGYRLNVPKGVLIDVPQTVAEIISESLNIYEHNAASAMRADRNDEVSSALNA